MNKPEQKPSQVPSSSEGVGNGSVVLPKKTIYALGIAGILSLAAFGAAVTYKISSVREEVRTQVLKDEEKKRKREAAVLVKEIKKEESPQEETQHNGHSQGEEKIKQSAIPPAPHLQETPREVAVAPSNTAISGVSGMTFRPSEGLVIRDANFDKKLLLRNIKDILGADDKAYEKEKNRKKEVSGR